MGITSRTQCDTREVGFPLFDIGAGSSSRVGIKYAHDNPTTRQPTTRAATKRSRRSCASGGKKCFSDGGPSEVFRGLCRLFLKPVSPFFLDQSIRLGRLSRAWPPGCNHGGKPNITHNHYAIIIHLLVFLLFAEYALAESKAVYSVELHLCVNSH